MGNNSSKQGAVVRADADGDKPSEDAVFTSKWSVGFAGKRYHNLHKGDSAANTPSRSVIDSPESGRSVIEGARLGGIGRLLNNRRGMRGDMLPAGLEAEKSPSVITLYSFDGISAADASETPSVSSLPVDQRAHSDGVKTSSPVATRCIGPTSGRSLACDVSSEPLLMSPNRTTMMTSLSVLALPSQGAVAPLDGAQRMRKLPTSMTDTTRPTPSGANFMSDTIMARPRGARTKERAIVIDLPAGTNSRDRHTPSYPPADRHPPADRCCRDAIALRTQMKTSEAGVMQQLRHEGIVAPGADELANRRKLESRSILSELRDMGLVSSAARDPPAPGSVAATTPRAPARLAAIEQATKLVPFGFM